eukprot:2087248-Amphidinium_carterae.1
MPVDSLTKVWSKSNGQPLIQSMQSGCFRLAPEETELSARNSKGKKSGETLVRRDSEECVAPLRLLANSCSVPELIVMCSVVSPIPSPGVYSIDRVVR